MTLRLIEATARLAARQLEQDANNRMARNLLDVVASAHVGDGSARTGVATWHKAQTEPFVAFSHGEPDWLAPAPDIEGPRRPLMRGEIVEWGQTAPLDRTHERVIADMKVRGDLLLEQQRAFDLLELPMMILGADPGAGDEQCVTIGMEWSGLPGDPFITLQRTRGVHGTQPWDYAAGEAA